MVKILVTGGAGFIGANFVHYMLKKHPGYKIVVLDKLTYAGKKENLGDALKKITFIRGDICDKKFVRRAMKGCDAVVHFAAETHVDNSIKNPLPFIRTNVFGTYILLDVARELRVKKFVHISTDEVYGEIKKGSFREDARLNPRNPYSATKAAADHLVLAYHNTYGLPVVIVRPTNNFGPFQYPEKLIPKFVLNALQNRPLTIYGTGKQVREWLYVEDNCAAIDIVLHKGKSGEIYNVGSGNEKSNLKVTKMILKKLRKPTTLIKFVADRPGHDWRYSLNSNKIKALGWRPTHTFASGMEKTIEWYLETFSRRR